MRHPTPRLLEPALLTPALAGAVRRLHPRWMARNPVMFVVWVGSVFTTFLALAATFHLPGSEGIHVLFTWQIAAWLWLTVIFANLATALAEGRGKAQADELKRQRATLHARRMKR
ncbi:MAG TPA: hypothetical protein VFI13_06375, partial [Gemmatimonadales bacterium]|nr:hypothetical protein [Gemmatimonadales bacterium]